MQHAISLNRKHCETEKSIYKLLEVFAMFIKTLKASMFLTLLLIVSVTLTGCNDSDSGDTIIQNIRVVVGRINDGLTGFVDGVVNVVSTAASGIQNVIGAVAQAGQQVVGAFQVLIGNASGTVSLIQGQISDVTQTATGTDRFVLGQTDALGQPITTGTSLTSFVNNPDSEAATATAQTDTAAAATASSTALMTDAELQQLAENVEDAVYDIADAVDDLTWYLDYYVQVSDAEAAEYDAQLDAIYNNLDQIMLDPTSAASRTLLQQTAQAAQNLINRAQTFQGMASDSLAVVQEIGTAFANTAAAFTANIGS